MKTLQGYKFKKTCSLNMAKMVPVYTIHILPPLACEWIMAGDGKGPFLFDSEEKRNAKLAELRKLARKPRVTKAAQP